ncbi:Bug family tripartite tricarboxylate transporter substrate binding protein [Belnapia rosea]|uniref:Tripartite-type tricarboxylate transporter, receptor component TctC n=1 Tax=Belnapia rosea TaxID=938405 RepID=A0A1G6VFZ6_9PROT|nr:tripartite tricarboxylate transporter substrate binding protein [Belnapia rosea]SDD51756.1 Tripartite-type tricarboxylate transporter, receptor component TctC [Belnapia rosea]
MVLPFQPGGATDAWMRTVAPALGEALGRTIVAENRSGASAMIGADHVAKSPPDGTTLLFTILTYMQAPMVFRRFPYDPLGDFTPVGQVGAAAATFVVQASTGARNLAEFIAAARGHSFSYGSYGTGSGSHVFSQFLSDAEGLGMTHVAYRGENPLILDMLAGRVQCGLVSHTSTREHIQAGKLRVLAVLGPKRLLYLPETPTFLELGYPALFDWDGVVPLLAPTRTPAPVMATLADGLRRAMAQPEIVRRLSDLGLDAAWTPPAATQANLEAAQTRWAKVLQVTGITAE